MNVAFFKNFRQLSMLKKFSTRSKVRIQAVFSCKCALIFSFSWYRADFLRRRLKVFFQNFMTASWYQLFTQKQLYSTVFYVYHQRENISVLSKVKQFFFLMQLFKVVVTELNQLKSNDINTVKQGAKATIFISSANPVKTCWFPPQHEKELCQLKVNLGRKMTFWLKYSERRCSDNIPTVFN